MDFCSTLLLRRRRSPMSPRSPVSRCLDKKVRKCMFFKNENIKIVQRKISNNFELSPKWASTTLSKLEMNSPDPSKWEWHTKWHTVTHKVIHSDTRDWRRFWNGSCRGFAILDNRITYYSCVWMHLAPKYNQNTPKQPNGVTQRVTHKVTHEWHTEWHTEWSTTWTRKLSDSSRIFC